MAKPDAITYLRANALASAALWSVAGTRAVQILGADLLAFSILFVIVSPHLIALVAVRRRYGWLLAVPHLLLCIATCYPIIPAVFVAVMLFRPEAAAWYRGETEVRPSKQRLVHVAWIVGYHIVVGGFMLVSAHSGPPPSGPEHVLHDDEITTATHYCPSTSEFYLGDLPDYDSAKSRQEIARLASSRMLLDPAGGGVLTLLGSSRSLGTGEYSDAGDHLEISIHIARDAELASLQHRRWWWVRRQPELYESYPTIHWHPEDSGNCMTTWDGESEVTVTGAPMDWAKAPPEQWPISLLTNRVRYRDGRSMIGASSFAMQHQDSVVIMTARHLLGSSGGIEPEVMPSEFDTMLEYWEAHPRGAKDASTRGIASAMDVADSSWVDAFAIAVPHAPATAQVLTPRDETVEVGEVVYLLGCERARPDCVQDTHQARVIAVEPLGFTIRLQDPVPAGGMSGAPIVDRNGRVIGLCARAEGPSQPRPRPHVWSPHLSHVRSALK